MSESGDPSDGFDELLRFREELDRLASLLQGLLGERGGDGLTASLESLRRSAVEIEARLSDVDTLERERDELMDRLIVLESALQSSNESRDQAVRLVGEIRTIVIGDPSGGTERDIVLAIQALARRGRSGA